MDPFASGLFYYKAAVLIHAERILKWAKSGHDRALTPGSKHAILPVAEFCWELDKPTISISQCVIAFSLNYFAVQPNIFWYERKH